MESKVNYTAVGLFVLIFSSALIAFAFWLGKYNKDEASYSRYKIHFRESVAGLAREAAVKYRGVDIGMVETIQINPDNIEEIELIVKVKKEAPIKIDSYAVLRFYGVTGLAYIEIDGGSKTASLLASENGEYPLIPTSPSLIKRLDESLSNVAAKLSVTLDRANRFFSDQNVDNVAQSLEHLRSLTAQIDAYQSEIKALLIQSQSLETNASKTLSSMKEAAENTKLASKNFNTLITTKMSTTLDSLEATSKASHALIKEIEKSIQRGDYDLASISAPPTKQLEELLIQTQTLTQEAESTLQSLRESPSDLLFKQSTPKKGPGE